MEELRKTVEELRKTVEELRKTMGKADRQLEKLEAETARRQRHPVFEEKLLFTGWDFWDFAQLPQSKKEKKEFVVPSTEDWSSDNEPPFSLKYNLSAQQLKRLKRRMDSSCPACGLPTEVYGIWEAYPWPFGEPYCIFKSFLSEMTSYASVLTITSFTIERYVAICHPIKAQTLSNLSRAVKIVFIIWILSALIALPYPIHTRVFPYVVVNGTALLDSLQCNVPFKWQRGMTYAFQISTFLFFIFPMIIISVMYFLIGANLKKSLVHSKHKSKTKARKAVIRMLVAVVVAFFCQWAPFHAQRLMTLYMPIEKWTPALIRFQSDLFYISGVLYFCNSTINPILYNVMSKKFRLAFKRTFCRCRYSPEELVDLNGKSKSIYYSDRTAAHSMRHVANNVTKVSFTDINGIKSNVVLLQPENKSEYAFINGGSRITSRSRFYQSQSTGRLNDFFNNIEHAQSGSRINDHSPRGSGSRLHLSPDGSLSFEEVDSDSMIELKSLSSYSSSTQLNSRLAVPQSKGYRVNRGSYV